ncbi:MAG: hypothetical protein ACXWLH_03400 [Candidatus Saccharimonadales bacterium]
MQTELLTSGLNVPPNEIIRQELVEQAFTRVPFAIGHAATQEYLRDFCDFAEFCFSEVDSNGKYPLVEAVCYSVNSNGSGIFYLERRRPGTINPNEPDKPPGPDSKDTMHFGPQTTRRATEALGGALPAEMKLFLEQSDYIWNLGVEAVRPVARAIGVEEIIYTEEREDHVILLRPLNYIPTLEDLLGETHLDRALITGSFDVSGPGAVAVAGTNGVRYPVDDIEYPIIDATEAELLEMVSHLEPIEQIEHLANVFFGGGMNHVQEPYHSRLAVYNMLIHAIRNLVPGQSRNALVMFFNSHLKYDGQPTSPGPKETGLNKIIERIREQAQQAA